MVDYMHSGVRGYFLSYNQWLSGSSMDFLPCDVMYRTESMFLESHTQVHN